MKTLNKAAKKNTYVIDCSNFNYLLFSEQPITPLIIIEKNGKPISDFGTSKKTPSLQFPNPCDKPIQRFCAYNGETCTNNY